MRFFLFKYHSNCGITQYCYHFLCTQCYHYLSIQRVCGSLWHSLTRLSSDTTVLCVHLVWFSLIAWKSSLWMLCKLCKLMCHRPALNVSMKCKNIICQTCRDVPQKLLSCHKSETTVVESWLNFELSSQCKQPTPSLILVLKCYITQFSGLFGNVV